MSDQSESAPSFKEELNKRRMRLGSVRATSVANSETLGTKEDLSPIESKRDALLDEIEALIDSAGRISPPPAGLSQAQILDLVSRAITQATPNESQIKQVVDNVRENRFQQMRQQALKGFEGQEQQAKSTIGDLKAVVGFELVDSLSRSGIPSEEGLRTLAKAAEDKLERANSLAIQVQESVRSGATDRVAEDASGSFDVLTKSAAKRANWWLATGVVAFLLLAGAIWWIWTDAFETVDLATVSAGAGLLLSAKALLLASAPLLLLRVAIRNYNSSHHLRVLYEHRDRILAQYSAFEQAISDDDVAAKNQLRLEVVRAAFSDPETGLLDRSKGELNLASVVQLTDGLKESAR